MKKIAVALATLLVAVQAQSQSKSRNIRLAESLETASHPAVSINHKEPDKNWVVGVTGKILVTRDGGVNWTSPKMESTAGNPSMPALITDGKGDFIVIDAVAANKDASGPRVRLRSRSTADGGQTWSVESFFGQAGALGVSAPRAGMEKGTIYVGWTRFERNVPADSSCAANVFFTSSGSSGKKWDEPVQLSTIAGDCHDDGSSMQAAAPIVNADGKLFMAWSNHGSMFLDRSFDGKLWLSSDVAMGRMAGSGNVSIPGMQVIHSDVIMTVDRSLSYYRNSLYITWNDQAQGADADIWFARSTNRGDFWSSKQRVNADSLHRHQFAPSIAVDEATGIIYMVYYSRVNDTDNQTDVFFAYSTDGGAKFNERRLSETPFSPSGQPFAGATAIAAYKGRIVPVWVRQDESGVSLWTALIRQEDYVPKHEIPRIQQIRRN